MVAVERFTQGREAKKRKENSPKTYVDIRA